MLMKALGSGNLRCVNGLVAHQNSNYKTGATRRSLSPYPLRFLKPAVTTTPIKGRLNSSTVPAKKCLKTSCREMSEPNSLRSWLKRMRGRGEGYVGSARNLRFQPSRRQITACEDRRSANHPHLQLGHNWFLCTRR